MSDGNLFWRIFIFGRPGLRMMLLFLPVLSVFIIRLANLHVGERNTASGFETIYQHLTAPRTYNTLWWYMVSAFVFGEVYIWSRGNNADLGWVDQGRPYERPRLNENPIVLRSLYMYLAVLQTCLHLYSERDTVQLLEVRGTKKQGSQEEPKLLKPMEKIQKDAAGIAQRSFKITVMGIVSIPLVYYFVLRGTAW